MSATTAMLAGAVIGGVIGWWRSDLIDKAHRSFAAPMLALIAIAVLMAFAMMISGLLGLAVVSLFLSMVVIGNVAVFWRKPQ